MSPERGRLKGRSGWSGKRMGRLNAGRAWLFRDRVGDYYMNGYWEFLQGIPLHLIIEPYYWGA
jgi:hypothetical protein